MSRRLRIEEEKAKQIGNELQDEEDKLKLLIKKIHAPLVWRRMQNGIRIQDLHLNNHEEVLQMIEEHYLDEEILTRNIEMSKDKVSQSSFLEKILFSMKDHSSLIAYDELNEEALVGCMILKAVSKLEYGRVFSRVMLSQGEAYGKLLEFVNYLNRKVDIYDQLQCDTFLRYYLICIKPEYRKKGLGLQMMQVGLEVARSLGIPVVMGVFSTFALQKCGKKVGMKVLHEVNYIEWVDKNGEMIFCDPGPGNYTCAVMAGLVPPPPEPEPPPPKPKDSQEKEQKLTRDEKRKLKAKKVKK